MARLARLVIPGLPHHVTQRGNRRQQTFFNDGDYAAYLELMADWCREEGVEIWSYCLMPNHVHLIAVPKTEDGLRRAIGEAHRRYTRRINFRETMARLFVAGTIRFVHHGRAVSVGGGAVCGVESRSGETGGSRPPVALEQREGAPVGPGRPVGQSRAVIGDGRRLESLFEECDTRRKNFGICENTGVRVGRWAVRRFWTVWKVLLAAF